MTTPDDRADEIARETAASRTPRHHPADPDWREEDEDGEWTFVDETLCDQCAFYAREATT